MTIREPHQPGYRAHKNPNAQKGQKGADAEYKNDETEVLLEKQGHHSDEDGGNAGIQKVENEAQDKETNMRVSQILIP